VDNFIVFIVTTDSDTASNQRLITHLEKNLVGSVVANS